MDIKILRNFSSRVSTKNLEGIMPPKENIDDVIKCDLAHLLELKLSQVENLYVADKRKLKFRHDSNLVISKFEGKLEEQPKFELEFEHEPFFECGINYLGRLSKKREMHLYIRIPGEGTYDPASSEPYLSKHDFAVITGFYSAGLYALRRGNPELLDKIFKIFKINKVYKRHKYLVKYMRYQIETTLINNREAKDYGLYLKEVVKYSKSQLVRKEFEDLTMYLNLFEICEKNEIFPSQRYWEKLIRERPEHENDKFVKFINGQNKNELYLLPEPEFVKGVSNLGPVKAMYDIRVLIRDLDSLNRDYSDQLKEELKKRNEEGSDMKDLVQPYHSCLVF